MQNSTLQSAQLDIVERQLAQDAKAERMLEIYATERFRTTGSAQRMRFRLVAWVIRNKLQENVKRAFDTMVALMAILVLWPIMLITARACQTRFTRPCSF